MANDTSRHPWALDTAAIISTDKIRVKYLRWVSESATAGDNVTVEDNNGEVIWSAVADDANYEEAHAFGDKGQDFDGFELASIDSGILYVAYV